MRNKDADTHIEQLRLVNFRRFESLAMTFEPDLCVLVASNGGGKTAVLDAIAGAWAFFLGGLIEASYPSRLSRDDVRKVVSADNTMERSRAATMEILATVDGKSAGWVEHLLASGKTATEVAPGTADAFELGRALWEAVIDHAAGKRETAPLLPFIGYYGTGRLWNTEKKKARRAAGKADTSRFSGYTDCLSPASSFRYFEDWFRRFAYETQSELASGRASPHKPRERLAAVRGAAGKVLAPSGWQQLEWDFAEDVLVASHPDHGRLPVRMLSDGIRTMIGLAGDIAHRCVRLNPHLGAEAASATPGVVLIDEVDMHLHPEWQQTVVPSVRAAFPGLQLIVTTHSHLVISTVPSRCVRILREDGTVSIPASETEGYDSPFALGTVFGVDPRPPGAIGQQLTRYRSLVEQGAGDSEEASLLRATLLEHFGSNHPAILEVEGLRRLQAFKTRLGARRGES
ncbi:MAG: AAA family ATPase [Polyangiaceae bacterium]